MNRRLTRSYGLFLMTLCAALAATAVRTAAATQAAVSDDALQDRIEHRVETDPMTKKYDIKVKVNHSDVTLSGTVASAAQKAEAAKLAKVDGSGKIDNEIAVDKDADKTLADRTKQGMRRTGEAITDAWITTKVKWFFLGEKPLDGSSINVDTKDRVVTLTGTVKSAAGRTRAVELANDTDGVTKVVDNLKIVN